MKAAVYIRVSTEEQARKGYSLNEQRESCEARARELGAHEVVVFTDEGVSGSVLDRPGLNQLRDLISREPVAFLVVRDPDRLSRRLSHQLLLTDELERFGVEMHFLDFDWQDTPDGRLFYAIRGAIAEYEKEKIRERMSRGRLQKARQGGIPTGFNAYGYCYQSDSGKLLLHPDESKLVADIFEWFVIEDLGCNGIARRLNERGEFSRRGRTWHRQVIRQLLSNPVYKGGWSYQGIEITVPVLVDKDTWEKAQKKLAESRRMWAGKLGAGYLLSGIAVCGDCGSSLNGMLVNWWGKKERRYTCYKNRADTKSSGCRPRNLLPAAALEKAVWDIVKNAVNDADQLSTEIKSTIRDNEGAAGEIENLGKKIRELEKRQESVLDALSAGLLDLSEKAQERLLTIKEQKASLEKRLQEAVHYANEAEIKGLMHSSHDAAGSILAGLDEMEFIDKRAVLRSLVKKVEVRRVKKGEVDIEAVIYIRLSEDEV
ncbi:MAG: recombinase family protein [Firmicutes bacterium]|nr:recombinase family protein [Bacillota bacterium]